MQVCDIIIPTYNGAEHILNTLEAIEEQHLPNSWRVNVIVSDDGSSDPTVLLAKSACQKLGLTYQVLTGPHTGAAGARNRALEKSQGDIVYLLGDDILLRPGAVSSHCIFHDHFPHQLDAAVGLITWDPRIYPTPLMEWMMHGGPQNDYDSLLGVIKTDAKHSFYAANLSIKGNLLRRYRFAENFGQYGWEDLELGRRLAGQGVRLHVLHQARALHLHHYQARDIIRRQRAVGAMLKTYQALHPADHVIPPHSYFHHFKHWVINFSGLASLLRLLFIFIAGRRSWPKIFSLTTTVEYWRGFYEA